MNKNNCVNCQHWDNGLYEVCLLTAKSTKYSHSCEYFAQETEFNWAIVLTNKYNQESIGALYPSEEIAKARIGLFPESLKPQVKHTSEIGE